MTPEIKRVVANLKLQPVSPQALRAMLARRGGARAHRCARGTDLLARPSAVRALGAAEPAGVALRATGAAPDTASCCCDDDDGLAERARRRCLVARRLHRSPCSTAATPPGAAGYELFSGVNVPSKAFGEFVEHESGTPSISAEELQCADERGRRHGGARQPRRSTNSCACRSRPASTCRAQSWCCACTTSRRSPTRWSWSIAPAARAGSSARSR